MCHLTFHKLCVGVVQLTETAEQKRGWLKELEGRTNAYIIKLSRINEALNRNLEAANMSKISDAERVKEFFIKTMHALRKKQEDLSGELERTYQAHMQALVDGKRDREELLTALYNARDLTRSLVDVGSDWEVMQEAESDLDIEDFDSECESTASGGRFDPKKDREKPEFDGAIPSTSGAS
nr:hypothetical protein BaRGS_025437 [Batillaria attramentaria]